MDLEPTVMLLSPARLDGKRAEMLVNPEAGFALAKELRSPAGAPLGTVFGFLSGLYFRGKALYAGAFGRAQAGLTSAFAITAGGGLCPLDERVTLERLRGWARVSVHEDNPHFTAPLQRHASGLLEQHGDAARFVLLGSIATNKYVRPLLEIFGERLLFPLDFAGLGDMSRGALLLRAVREGRELAYGPIADALVDGTRRGRAASRR
ncbi:MAG TPA: hypothetical protein VFZ53_08680 [Polyangiaceae bacterium]